MTSKITAIVAVALVLGLRVLRRRKPTGTLAGKRLTPVPTTTRIREICATGTQTTASSYRWLGRCLTALHRTKCYSNRIVSFLRAVQEWQLRPARCCHLVDRRHFLV